MQANNILTATDKLDKSGASAKSGKSNSSATPEVSFNQMLNKEISSAKKPEMDTARSVNKAPAPAKNNNVNNNNNNNANSNNKLANNDNAAPAPAPVKTEKTDTGSTDGTAIKEEETDTSKEVTLSEQILALVGNLAPPPVNAEAGKPVATSALDASKTASLNGIDVNASAVSSLQADAALASAAQVDAAALDKAAAQAANQFKPEAQAGKPEDTSKQDVAAIAAQIMGNKADGKSIEKLPENGLNAAAAAISAKQAGESDITALPPAMLAQFSPSLTKGATATTAASNGTPKADITEEATIGVKLGNIEPGKTVSEKASDSKPIAAADTPKTFASDIALAKDGLAERMAEIKASPAGKDGQQVMGPPAIAANAVNSTQFNAAILASEQIAPRVGTNGWDKAVGQKVVWMVGEGLQSAELTLNPPDLGPLQVVLSVTNDQASARFSSAQPEVREALEAALPRLKQMLSDAGVQLSGFSVNSQAPGQGQNFTQQQARDVTPSRSSRDIADNNVAPVTTSPARIQTNNGLVDTFA